MGFQSCPFWKLRKSELAINKKDKGTQDSHPALHEKLFKPLGLNLVLFDKAQSSLSHNGEPLQVVLI